MSTAVGQAALRERLRLRVPPPAVESYLVAGARRTEIRDSHVVESFPQRYAPGESAVSHLRFALRYEPIDLGVFAAALKVIDPAEIAEWVRREPTGGFARRTWFLNLLGDAGLCPTVRRTRRLETWMAARLGDDARALTARYDPAVLARAVNYLYTKETGSSFAIEGETPSPSRTERFVAALRSAADFDPADHAAIVRLKGSVVDPRYAAAGWRDFQNWVGGVAAGYREAVDFIPPRPEDVPGLMEAWTRLTCGLDADDLVDPVVAAAVSAFAFVFEWRFTPDRRLIVENDTADLYRYFDATPPAEYLYDRVADTVHRELEEELDFVSVYDRALAAVKEIVDMPDRRASRFMQLCMGNGGRLAGSRRAEFAELADDEIGRLEAAVQAAMSASGR